MKSKKVIASIVAFVLCASCAGCGSNTAQPQYTTDKSLSLTFSNNKTVYFGENRPDIEKDFGTGKDIKVGMEYDVGATPLMINYRDNKAVYISTNGGSNGKSGLGVAIGDDSTKVTTLLGKPIKSSSLEDEYIFTKENGNNISPYSKSADNYSKSYTSWSDKELENHIYVIIQSHDEKVVTIEYMDCLFGNKNK